ncbi:hypothetical protein [Pseudobacillus badius]|uniref:hypothetical protein n=1 Tax=Bacillus badius TaxID=1455 RepID=UPI003D34A3F2
MSEFEALRELGVIHELVISLFEKLDDQVLQDEVSVIREKVVTATQRLLDS